jgi:D-alanyl-D-alanine carboxypeptidase (penicillin-binding protein 5/6)
MGKLGKMGKLIKRIGIIAMVSLFVFAAPKNIHGSQGPEVHAVAHILIEAESGRIISEYQAHRRMFPAATTRILTAILAYEYIGLDEIIVAGSEMDALPGGSARNWHQIGEAISGANLLRGMLIGAGNDTANIVALEVAKRSTGNANISFANAQATFTSLMTQRARELGALDSNFVNPHGYHHDNHFTTAYDMAQISRHALSIPILAQIMAQPAFSGLMCGGGEAVEGAIMQTPRTWNSPNELLHADSRYHYPYAIGLRTGMTNQAGESLAAAATRDGITLVSVTFNSPLIPAYGEDEYVPTRWQDNINLFEYGFTNYAHRVFLEENAVMGRLPVYDPQLDDEGYLEFFSTSLGMLFLSNAEMGRLQQNIEFVPDIVTYTEEYGQMFVTPIYENDAIGTVSYYLDGEMIFTTAIYASRYVPERTAVSDIEIRLERINEIFFSAAAIPYWIAAVAVLTLIIVLIVLARRSAKRKRNNYKYKWKY